ncbi:MAG: hypothetical protein AAGF12_04460 [Myxococcota bacterium]
MFWCASEPAEGAIPVPAGEGRMHVAGGFGTLLPTFTLGGTLGVGDGVDLDLRYETYAALSHDISLTSRISLAEYWAVALSLNHVFFLIEDIGGVESADAPVGNGLSLAPSLFGSFFLDSGVHVALGASASFRFIELVRNEDGTLTRQPRLTLAHAALRVAVEWEGDGATTFLRFSAVVPIQADFRVLGYLPHISFGRSFQL